jgi:hypothetical protein
MVLDMSLKNRAGFYDANQTKYDAFCGPVRGVGVFLKSVILSTVVLTKV